jgi:hypothetical protein
MKTFLITFYEKEEVLGKGKNIWQLMELQDAFNDALINEQLPPLELFIDALDECDEDQVRRFVRFVDALDKSPRQTRLPECVLVEPSLLDDYQS